MATIASRKTPQSLRSERAFFLGMMALIAMLVVWGFLPSFFLRDFVTPPATYIDRAGWMGWVFIAHGVLFMLWLALFALQTVLIGSKRLPLHKQIGRSSYPLYVAIVAMGLFVGYLGAKHGFHDVPFDSVTFSALPWLVILAYAILAWAGLNERKDPQRHKRLMLLATIAIADAGVARVALLEPLTPEWMSRTVLLIIPLIIWDLATLRRVHPTTARGGLLVAAALLLSVPIGMTRPWHVVVSALTGSDGVPTGHTAF
jgi:hypothetical protein